MKTKILSQIAALMALGVATQGCSDNWTADVGGEGEGVLATSSLLPTVTNEEHFVEEIRGAQQNGRSGGSRASINLTDFIVEVTDAGGAQAAAWTYGTMPSLPTFPVGNYTVTVRSHRVNEAAWSEPYFLGTQSFKITSGELTYVDPIICKLSNIKVSVKFDKKLLAASADNGADFQVTVTSKPGVSLTYTVDETRAGYFEAFENLETLSIEFTGTVSGVKETVSAVLTNVEAGQHRQITMGLKNNSNPSPDESGNITIDKGGINVDFSVRQEDMTANLQVEETPGSSEGRPGEEEGEDPTPPDPGNEDAITFSSTTLDIEGGANIADEFGPGIKDAVVKIHSDNGVRNLNVEIISDFLTDDFLGGVGMVTKFDLANADDTTVQNNGYTLATNLRGLGFPVNEEVVGKNDLDFDITQFMPLILKKGDHTFKITVTDQDGNRKEMRLLIRQETDKM